MPRKHRPPAIVRSITGTSTISIFAGSQVIAEYDNGAVVGSPSRENIYALGQRVAEISGSTTYYYQPDNLSVRLLTDSSGNTLGQRGHFPFGETWYESGATTPIKFTSYTRDSESGNDYAMAREYINRFGRFMSVDPTQNVSTDATNPQSWNLYAYGLNNPISLRDPTGLWCVWDDGSGHDPDPSAGGWDETGCKAQGGNWDPSDSVYNIYTDSNGYVTGIDAVWGSYMFPANFASLDAFDSAMLSFSNSGAPTMSGVPANCSFLGRLWASTDVNVKVGLAVVAGPLGAADASINFNTETHQVTANAGAQLAGNGPSAQRSLFPGSLNADNVDPGPKFTWNTAATETNLSTGVTTLNPSASKMWKFGGAIGLGADASLDLGRFNQTTARCNGQQ